MKRFLLAVLCLSANAAWAANIDYHALLTNYFTTNGYYVGLNTNVGSSLYQFTTNVTLATDFWNTGNVGNLTTLHPIDTSRAIYNHSFSTNYEAMDIALVNTNAQTFTLAGYFLNQSSNSAGKNFYYQDGAYGLLGEMAQSDNKVGEGTGTAGIADSWWINQAGILGFGWGQVSSQTNYGVYGTASPQNLSNSFAVGGYFEVFSNAPATMFSPTNISQSSVIRLNNRDSAAALLIADTNSVYVFGVTSNGLPQILPGAGVGKVLTSDGSGVGTWQPPPAVGAATNVFIIGGTNVLIQTNAANNWTINALQGTNINIIQGTNTIIQTNGPTTWTVSGLKPPWTNTPANVIYPVVNSSVSITNDNASLSLYDAVKPSRYIVYMSGQNVDQYMVDEWVTNINSMEFYWTIRTNDGVGTVNNIAAMGMQGFNLNLGIFTGNGLGITNIAGTNVDYSAGTNVIFTTNGHNVTISSQPGGVSSTSVSNIIDQYARIGPGTLNQIAKFVNPTNVGDSIVKEVATNEWDWLSRANPNTWTNNITNRMYGSWGSSTNWLALDLVSATEVSFFELHGVQGSSHPSGIPPLKLMGSVFIEPSANPLGGHTAGYVTPVSNGTQALGTTSQEWHGVYSDSLGFRAEDITALSGNHNFYSVSDGIGMSTSGIEFDTIADGFLGGVKRDSTTALRGFVIASAGNGVYSAGTGGFNQDTFITRGALAGTWSFSTNNASTLQPKAGTLEGGEGTGTDHMGSDLVLLGGLSTGATNSGAVLVQTAQSTGSSASKNVAWTRAVIVGEPVNLTESSATLVCTVSNITAGHFAGIKVSATTDADDTTDFQAVTEDFRIAAVNKGGTVTTSISASAPMATVQSAGTLTTTWSAVANNNGIDIKNNAVSSLTQTTLRTRYRIEIDSDVQPTVYDVQKLIHQ